MEDMFSSFTTCRCRSLALPLRGRAATAQHGGHSLLYHLPDSLIIDCAISEEQQQLLGMEDSLLHCPERPIIGCVFRKEQRLLGMEDSLILYRPERPIIGCVIREEQRLLGMEDSLLLSPREADHWLYH